MRYPLFLTCSLILVLAFLVQDNAATASGLNLSKVKPLAQISDEKKPEFEANSNLISETPYNDAFLGYEIRLPKDWSANTEPAKTIDEDSLNRSVLGDVARYTSPARQHLRSFVTVEVLELTYEISTRNWFINYVLSNGLSLEQVGTETDRIIEAIYIEVKGDVTYIVRVKAISNGPRMIMARHYLPQEMYASEHTQQAYVIDSFKLTNREERGVEELKVHAFLDQSFFDYPESWIISAPMIRNIDRMRAMLFHGRVKGKLDGQINLYITRKGITNSRSETLRYYQEKFKIPGYITGGVIDNPILEYHSDMSFGVTQIYEMIPQTSQAIPYELWISFIEGEDFYYVVSLLSPARDTEFYIWARNKEAFKLMVKGIRRHDESVDYFKFIRN